jgi:hypothetical protein
MLADVAFFEIRAGTRGLNIFVLDADANLIRLRPVDRRFEEVIRPGFDIDAPCSKVQPTFGQHGIRKLWGKSISPTGTR